MSQHLNTSSSRSSPPRAAARAQQSGGSSGSGSGSGSPPRQQPQQHQHHHVETNIASHYFESDCNVFYRPDRNVALSALADAPMGTLDWGVVPERSTEEERQLYEMDALQSAVVIERHPCGEKLRALLNASRSLPVGTMPVDSRMSGSKGNFKRALEVAAQAGGSGGASHSLLYSRGGPERRPNTAQLKWGPVKFSDMGTVALGERITQDVIELRRAFSKRDAVINFPDHVTPEALNYAASRFGPNWEMFDIAKHADLDSRIMEVFMDRHSSTASRKALSHGAESAAVSYDANGNPVWHRTPGEKAILTGAFRVAEHDDPGIIGPDDTAEALADTTLPLPPLGDRPLGWPREGPGFAPPSSQDHLRQKRFRLEDRVPALREVLDADNAKRAAVVAPPPVATGVRALKAKQRERVAVMTTERLPVWRAVKPGTAAAAASGGAPGAEPERAGRPSFDEYEASPPRGESASASASATADESVGRRAGASAAPRPANGGAPMSPARLRNTVAAPDPRPGHGQWNPPLQVRAARIVDDHHGLLQSVERARDARGRVIVEDDGTGKVGELAQLNTKTLGLLLSPPPVPFSAVRRSHTAPMLPFLAVSGVPKFDAVTATAEQSTQWKALLSQI